MPIYRGLVRQRGYGLGGMLQSYGSRTALPYLAKNVLSPVVEDVAGGITEVINNPKDYKRIATTRGNKALKRISGKVLRDLLGESIKSNIFGGGDQSGSGSRKRGRKRKPSSSKQTTKKRRRVDFLD